MNEAKLTGLLGMARKAGRVAMGTEGVLSAIERRQAKLVLVDDGASKNTKNRFLGICRDRNVPAMGLPAGKMANIYKWDKLALVAVLDEGFARAIDRAIREKVEKGENNSIK